MQTTLERSKTSSVYDHRGVPKTQGEIEAAVSRGMSKFEQEYMGRGPKGVRAHLIGDLLVVRLRDVLTAAERHLVATVPVEKGRGLLKEIRSQLIEDARPALESLVEDITGIEVHSLHHDISTVTGEEVHHDISTVTGEEVHHDISTVTGEEVVMFTLLEAPDCRQPKKR